MKIVINTTWGGFEIPKAYCELTGCHCYDDYLRDSPDFIQWVEDNHPVSLEVVEIPEYATDWELMEYDGLEHIICVISGRLYHINKRSIWDAHGWTHSAQ